MSSPADVLENMNNLIDTINSSEKHVFDKCVFLAQEIWIHQPFVDGNKRTGRLLINFFLMKSGYPLFSFNNEKSNYNNLLVEQYYDSKPDLIKNYIVETLSNKMNLAIESYSKINNDFKGFRLMF